MSTKLKDLPSATLLPRERLIQEGRAALETHELIAMFLRTGIQGCNVLEVSKLLLQQVGSLKILAKLEAHEIAQQCKGIGLVKAATLAAAFELGERAAQEAVIHHPMKSASAVYDYLSPETYSLTQEKAFALLLNSKLSIIRKVDVSSGTVNETIVHPRDVLRVALQFNAHSFILAHNHPSGDPTPSEADRRMTQQISAAAKIMGIPMRDHVILGSPSVERRYPYYSFASNGEC